MIWNPRASAPVALITGGASGMGLSVTRHLVEQGWKVTIVDYNAEAGKRVAQDLGNENVLFAHANVADYDQQARAFVATWNQWSRLDFVYANAGILDRIPFCKPAEERDDGAPVKPDMAVVDICLDAAIYSAYLALHYFRKNPDGAGKLGLVGSMGAIYPSLGIPVYSAAKHGVVGLTRALGQTLERLGEPITVNCICPGMVETNISDQTVPPEIKHLVTPHSTIVRAVSEFLADPSKTGIVAECSVDKIHYRAQPEWADEAAKQVMTNVFQENSKAPTAKAV